MRHAILGPGGVGGLIGAVLAAAGNDVTLVVRPGSRAVHPNRLTLESPFGNIDAPASVVERLTQPADIVWVTLKATQLADGLDQISAASEAAAVIPLLNGIDHVDLLRRRLAHQRVIPATISVESERTAPGRITVRSPFIRLRVARQAPPEVREAIAELQRFGIDCAYVADEATLLWSKLVFLAPIALSTTAARATIGEILANDVTRRRLEACLHETCAVASAAGATVDERAALAWIRQLPPGMRSSMQKDDAAELPIELDAIAGPILRGGRRFRLPVSATEELARELEHGRHTRRA